MILPPPPDLPGAQFRWRLCRLPAWLLAALALLALLAVSAAGGWLLPADSARAQSGQSVPSDWPLIPSGIDSGDSFRLLFVTSATRNASSADIADYNAHVRNAANGNASLKPFKSGFTALISTGTVDARDNTATTGTGVPIHWLGGAQVADDYADLYDKDWDSVSGKTESGGSYTGLVWTGSNKAGEKSGQRHAGAEEVRLGDLSDATLPLSSPQAVAATESYPLYALSPVFTVAAPEPEPTATPTPTPQAEPEPANAKPAGPTITAGPSIVSSPASGDTYGKGEAVVVAVTFSEAVTVSGQPRVRLAVGERQRWARYDHSRQDGTVLVFAYQVKGNDRDEDGVSIPENGLGLNRGSIADSDGNAANLDHAALAVQAGHKVDGSREAAPAEGQQQQESPVPAAPNSQRQVTSNQGSGQARVQRLEMASTGPYYYNDVIKIRAVFTGIPSGHTLLRQTASRSGIDKIQGKGTDSDGLTHLPGGFSGGSASISIKLGNTTVPATDCEIKDNTVTFCYRVPYSLWIYDPNGVSVDAGSIRFGDRFEDLTLITAEVNEMAVAASECQVRYCQITVLDGQVYSENNLSNCESGCTHYYMTGIQKINAAHGGLSSPGASHLADGLRIRDRPSNDRVVKISMDKASYERHGRSHSALGDPYLRLFRVESSGSLTQLVVNDDGGTGNNAEIRRSLAPGNYLVKASTPYQGTANANFYLGGYKLTFRSTYQTTVPPQKPLSHNGELCQYTLRHDWYAYEGWFYNYIGRHCDNEGQYFFTVHGDGWTYSYPSAPGNLRATAGNGQVTLSWDRKNDSDIYEWLLWREDDGKWRQISRDPNLNRHVVTGLTNGQTYKFALRAAYQSRGAVGVPSAVVTATPD